MICSPKFSTRARPERPNRVERVERVARLFGFELLPWQRLVALVATEYHEATGVPYWREVFVTTPRQSGKTSLILILMLERCLTWPTPQQCVWTGQDGSAIRSKWMNEIIPALERSELAPMIKKVRRANGNESIEWQTGSRIELLPTTETAGHGMVVDFAVQDEIWADADNRRDASLLPAMATKADAQMLTCSTAGTAASTVYNRKVRSGRNAVAEDRDSGLAYFEWSAPEGWDPNDDESFYGFHPAVGHTISLSVIRQARETFTDEPEGFARAYGNRPMLEGSDVIPAHVWERVVSDRVAADPDRGITIAVDVTHDRSAGAVAMCDDSGAVELMEYRSGVGWLVERALELSDRYAADVVFDGKGPAGSIDGLHALPRSKPMSSSEVIEACGLFYDAVADGNVAVRRASQLDMAISGLVKKQVGDRYVWSRRASSKDVAPLYAATLAFAASKSAPKESDKSGFAFVMGGV